MDLVYQNHQSTCAINQIIHAGQTLCFKKFGWFIKDMKYPLIFLTKSPQEFHLKNVKALLTFHYSKADQSTSKADMDLLKSNVGNNGDNVYHVQVLEDLAHVDFVYGKTVNELVWSFIVDNLWRNAPATTP